MSTLDFDKLSREVRANTNRSTRNNNRINHIESKLIDIEEQVKELLKIIKMKPKRSRSEQRLGKVMKGLKRKDE